MSSNVERELGAIIAKLEFLEESSAAANEASKKSRHEMTTKLDTALRAQESLQRDVAVMKPVFEEISRWRLIGLGAVLSVGAIGTMVGLSLATAREFILKLIGWH